MGMGNICRVVAKKLINPPVILATATEAADAIKRANIVDKMLGKTRYGAIGLWVDIATIGYFKDLRITRQ